MSNKYLHRLFEKKMKAQEAKIGSIFLWIKDNPDDTSRDKDLLKEMEKMSAILDEYKEACQSG